VKRLLGILLLAAVGGIAAYGAVVTQREATYRDFVEEGDAALARDDSFAAIEAFSVAISLKADSMAAYLKRGEAYRRRAEFDAAARDLQRAAEIDPVAIYPRELLGDVHYAVGTTNGAAARTKFAAAQDQYREAVSLDDQSARLHYKLGLAAFRAGQLPAAIAALRSAIKLEPRFPEAHYVLGMSLRASQQTEEAVGELERAVSLAPALLAAREELVDIYASQRRYEARLTHLEALLALQPAASRERALGIAYARAGNLDRAVGQLARATQRYPNDGDTYVALGRLWLDRGSAGGRVELGKALEALRAGVNDDSTSEAMTLFGRALLMSGDVARAEQMLQRATTRYPVDPDAFLHLADAAQRRGRLVIAQRALIDYAALIPAASIAGPLLARIGEAHMQLGDLEAARRTIDAALAKDPGNLLAIGLKHRLN
jgi:tetratricopeptide (TPR) repeat protein